ncbi:glycoside hydrolase family 88 protein [Thalassotalea sp. SU-HH00458]|uniref:glycoside hydrolase family 88/105 protein n=1 Tax=Thalassotalea sp. SU-HH00458 TaxID=3127657 RepID=UPI003108573A
MKKISKVSCILITSVWVALSGCSVKLEKERTQQVFKAPRLLPYTIDVAAPMSSFERNFSKESVLAHANLVADWQIRHQNTFLNSPLKNFQGMNRYSFGGWLMGTMSLGMVEWGQIKGNEKYLNFILNQAEQYNWQVERRVYDADDYIIGQLYLELYDLYPQRVDLTPLQERLDYIYANWPTVNKEAEQSCHELLNTCRERWTWIDALFMGAPVWAHMAKTTEDAKYLEFSEYEYWASFNKFWDSEESLLYRDSRFLNARDVDDKKIFWSRGNGWTISSLVRMLEILPKEHNKRAQYIGKFKEMANKLAEIQQPDGSWHPSLINPKLFDMPDNSGSSFFTYALAWGVNQGILEKSKYQAVVEKAWSNLSNNIYADGRLAYVQSSGYDPRTVRKEDTDVYGVGAFLLAASQVYILAH